MVVVEQLDAQLLCYLAKGLDVRDDLVEAISRGAVVGGQIGDCHVLTADLGVLSENSLGCAHHVQIGNVSGNGGETDLLAHLLDVCGAVAVKSGELYAVIAHCLDFFQSAAQVCLGVLTYRINLYRYG